MITHYPTLVFDWEPFDNLQELTDFINERRIPKENIQQIETVV